MRPQPTQAELAVLEALWGAEPTTIRVLTDAIYPEGGTAQYATVQKLLDRLEEKGFVSRDRSNVPHRFSTRVDRSSLITARLHDVADSLCGGSMSPLLTHLVESAPLSKEDVDALRDLVRRLDTEEGSSR